jgi:hypothetical protein
VNYALLQAHHKTNTPPQPTRPHATTVSHTATPPQTHTTCRGS